MLLIALPAVALLRLFMDLFFQHFFVDMFGVICLTDPTFTE